MKKILVIPVAVFILILSVILLPFPIDTSKSNEPPGDSCFDFFPASGDAKAVVVVAHGLNLNPGAMMSMAKLFNELSMDVYLLRLYGHREDTHMGEATYGIWMAEAEYVYLKARNTAVLKQVPLYFSGYSLGALVFNNLALQSGGRLQFDKQILLAPATALRDRSCMIKAFFLFGDRFMIPSMAPEEYRANKSTSVAAYKILFHLERQLRLNKFTDLNFPTIIFVDTGDELVSAKKLLKQKEKFQLDQYGIYLLNGKGKFRHLIIDKHSAGSENWHFMKQKITQFLVKD